MKYIYSFLLLILFLTFSCNRGKAIQEISEKLDTINVSSDRIVNTIGETLIPTAKIALEEWKEYKNVDEFILKYYNISIMDALTNAQELSNLVKSMRDTIRIKELDRLNVVARFNVLHNETLRLADMATIASIKDDEVKEEVGKILEVYDAVNSKINTVYKALDFQNSFEGDTILPVEIKEKTKTPNIEYVSSKSSSKKVPVDEI